MSLGSFYSCCQVYRTRKVFDEYRRDWYSFDYRDPSVVVATLKLLRDENKFVIPSGVSKGWFSSADSGHDRPTLEEAAARAVIALRKA